MGLVSKGNWYIEGHWEFDYSLRSFVYYSPGEYNPTETKNITPTIVVGELEATKLIPLLEERHYIIPRLDERLRAEDLKITHRLFDLLDKKVVVE